MRLIFNLSDDEQFIDVLGYFDGTEIILLYGQGSDILKTKNYSITEDGLKGKVALKPWEFWIVLNEE